MDRLARKLPGVNRDYLIPMKPVVKKKRMPPVRLRAKNSTLAAVEVPHSGASYNPEYNEHQAVLRQAHEEAVRERQEENRFKERMRREPGNTVDNADLDDSDSDEDEEDGEESEDKVKVNVAHVERKKKSERNKEKRKRQREHEERMKKSAKEAAKKLAKIDEVAKEVEENAQAAQAKNERAVRRLGPDRCAREWV